MWITSPLKIILLLSLTLGLYISASGLDASAQAPQEPQTTQEDFKIRFPAKCEYGVDCWLMNTPDMNSGQGDVADSLCGPRSYDGHKGVDFAIRDITEMNRGVDVLAVAKGKVLRLRDGVEDSFPGETTKQTLDNENKNCGNGIIIDHENGYLSQYCHLKKGSIIVKPEQNVMPSQKIAEIGLSGITDHPHIHLTVIHKGKIIDPFTGKNTEESCQTDISHALWENPDIRYKEFALYDAGFATSMPDFSKISSGTRGDLPRTDSESFLFWIAYFGAREDDEISMQILDPEDKVFISDVLIQDKTRARQYYAIGKKSPAAGLQQGTWKAVVTVKRPETNTTDTLTRGVVVF